MKGRQHNNGKWITKAFMCCQNWSIKLFRHVLDVKTQQNEKKERNIMQHTSLAKKLQASWTII